MSLPGKQSNFEMANPLCSFVSAFSSLSLSIKPTSSVQLIGTLTLLYGMKCCPILE
jgi:hypothetical protein